MAKIFYDFDKQEYVEVAHYTTVEQAEAFKKKQVEYNRGSRNGRMFFFINMDRIERVQEMGLTNKQIGQFIQLATYADYDGYLIRANGSERPLYTLKDLSTVLGIKSADTVRKVRNTLLDVGLMYEDIYTTQTGDFKKAYRLNPDYVYRGKAKTKVKVKAVVKAYSTAIRELYTESGGNAVGIISKLLPYVSIDNVLAHNPLEAETDLLEPFTYEDIAKALGCNVTETRRHITSIKYKGMKVVIQERIAGKKVFRLNPALFSRKAVEANRKELDPFVLDGCVGEIEKTEREQSEYGTTQLEPIQQQVKRVDVPTLQQSESIDIEDDYFTKIMRLLS